MTTTTTTTTTTDSDDENDFSIFAFINEDEEDSSLPIFDGIEKSKELIKQEEENYSKKKRKINETISYFRSIKKQVIEKTPPISIDLERGNVCLKELLSTNESKSEKSTTEKISQPKKPKSKLDEALSKINEKQKSTISQSKEDWKQYKKQEGIEHELKQYTKDGYLEKQAFLERTEIREFEIGKELRNEERKRKEQQNK